MRARGAPLAARRAAGENPAWGADRGEALPVSLRAAPERYGPLLKKLSKAQQMSQRLQAERERRTLREAEALQIGLQKAVDQRQAAESLIGKLGGEKQRWSETSASLGDQLKELPLNSILAAGFAVYLSDETETDSKVGNTVAYSGMSGSL